jgi:hypothetical protein
MGMSPIGQCGRSAAIYGEDAGGEGAGSRLLDRQRAAAAPARVLGDGSGQVRLLEFSREVLEPTSFGLPYARGFYLFLSPYDCTSAGGGDPVSGGDQSLGLADRGDVDQAAVEAHRATDYFKALGRKMGEFMDGRADVVRLREVE